jgi:aspartate/methionine/tyrosine aminotransferase
MKHKSSLLFSLLVLWKSLLLGQAEEEQQELQTIFLQPNTTQIFTELYQANGLLDPLERTFFEEALYLDQSAPPPPLPLQPSNQAIFDHASQVLSEFHKQVGDLELYIDPNKPKPFFYTAAGSKHLIAALVYGIAMTEPEKKFVFVEQAPYYSGHPDTVKGLFHYPNARFLSFHDPSEIHLEPDEVLVEFVTSPNNPDGKFRKPLTNARILIADFVFASSAFGEEGAGGYLEKNLAWIREARSQGKTVFSFNSASKQFGKTGARCGYIWYPIYDTYAASVFKKFFSFISSSTVAGGSIGLADFLNLIKMFLDMSDTGKALREDCRKSLVKRHILVEKELLSRYPGSKVISIPGSPTFFVEIKDERIPKQKAAEVLVNDVKTVVNPGEPMGESNAFVRLNISGYSQVLVEFLNRLAHKKKYTVDDVFISTTRVCNRKKLIGFKINLQTVYAAHPGDCYIEADATDGVIEILFPPFIDYENSSVITVKKVDASIHHVKVKSDNFTFTLKKAEDKIQVQWSQPLYQDGKWSIVP